VWGPTGGPVLERISPQSKWCSLCVDAHDGGRHRPRPGAAWGAVMMGVAPAPPQPMARRHCKCPCPAIHDRKWLQMNSKRLGNG
jgi:hypothetical protein